jgi:hypothetical protein
MTDGEGPIDFTDSLDVDALLDRIMPIIQAACIVNAEVVTNTAMFQRSIELHEKLARRDVHFWNRHGKNGVRSIERPVMFDPKRPRCDVPDSEGCRRGLPQSPVCGRRLRRRPE